jgi:hypothetical protein
LPTVDAKCIAFWSRLTLKKPFLCFLQPSGQILQPTAKSGLKNNREIKKYDSGFGTQTFWVQTLNLSHYELGRPVKRKELAALSDYVSSNLLKTEVSMKGDISGSIKSQ